MQRDCFKFAINSKGLDTGVEQTRYHEISVQLARFAVLKITGWDFEVEWRPGIY
jgi:hypothetical protein